MSTRATPFHTRAAAANTDNLWINRNGWTLSVVYSDTAEEALAARAAVVMADITWRWRVMLEGANAAAFLSRLTTKRAEPLAPGTAHKALWLNDKGGVRGAGLIARYGRESFLLAAAAPDKAWIEDAAQRFGVTVREVDDGGLALIGSFAKEVLDAAGLDAALEPLAFRKLFWRGLDVTVSRWGEHGGYEIWCEADDGIVLWDRLMKAGAAFGILTAGTAAADMLDMEAGVARPLREWRPAIDGVSPSPRELGFEKLIAEDHTVFNGRAAYLTAKAPMRLVGVTLDSEEPVHNGAILYQTKPVGWLVSNLYSPALKRVIGWARLEEGVSAIGTAVTLRAETDVVATVVDLPFLAAPRSNRGMKHASQTALDRLEPLLADIRKRGGLKEKSRGAFYFRSRALLHFHEHGEEFFADLRTKDDFERFPATTRKDWKALLAQLDGTLNDGTPLLRR